MAKSKSIVGCDANDLLQYFSSGQDATDSSLFLHTPNSFADIMSLVPDNISPCKYHDLNSQNNMFNSSKNLFLLHLNIRSLQKNHDNLCEFLDQLPIKPHLIGLSETKIKHQPFLDISLPNYNFIHAASPTNAGGVGLYISDSLEYEILGINSIDTSGCESLFIKLSNLTSKHLAIVGVIYRHPKNNIALFTDKLSTILDSYLKQPYDITLVGDFNINLDPEKCQTEAWHYLDTLLGFGLFPVITKPTRVTATSKSLIDHIFTNITTRTISSGIYQSDITDHFPIFCLIHTNAPKHKKVDQRGFYRDYKVFSLPPFQEDIKTILQNESALAPLTSENNVNSVLEQFISSFKCVVDKHAPIKRASRKKDKLFKKPWLTKGLLISIKNKQKMYKNNFLNGNDAQKLLFKTYSNKLTKVKRLSKKMYFYKEFDDNQNNSRKMWKTINSLLHNKTADINSPPKNIKINDKICDNQLTMAEHFNNFFCTIGKRLAEKMENNSSQSVTRYLTNRVSSSIFLEPVDERELISIINLLPLKKSVGHDNIPVIFIKLVDRIIAPFLVKVINASFDLGMFPNILKIAKVIPIYKSGDKQLINNYRPISLLSPFSKIYEKLLFNRFYKFLDKKSILIPTQYGFRPHHSTQHAILDIITTAYHNINIKNFTGLVTLDLTKAFDTVCHERLLIKLHHYGFRGKVNKLIGSYFSNRKQYVCLGDINSSQQHIGLGVPQGSTLGPLFFLLYINDLPNATNSLPRLFADDTCLILSHSSVAKLEKNINQDLANVSRWAITNQLTINPTKSHLLIVSPYLNKSSRNAFITLDSSIPKVEKSIKYLGINVDNQLLFGDHIKQLRTIVSRAVGIMTKIRHFIPLRILKQIYFAFIHSHLTYGIIVWGATFPSYLTPLKSLQNRAIKLLSGVSSRLQSAQPLYKENNILSLNNLLSQETAKFMYKFIHKQLPVQFDNYFDYVHAIHKRSTRTSQMKNQLYIPRFRTNRLQRSIKYRGVKVWNDIPNEIKDNKCNFSAFKRINKKYLISQVI